MHTIIGEVLTAVVKDTWGMIGYIGVGLMASFHWLVVNLGEAIGTASAIAGFFVVCLVITEKVIDILAKLKKRKKGNSEDIDPGD